MSPATVPSTTLKQQCTMQVEVHDGHYEAREIVGGGEFLYDPQVFWQWDPRGAWASPADSILISDIGGQEHPGWDPTMGHGALYRLHPNNRLETLMAPGRGRQAGIFRPIIAPAGWGEFGGHIFFGSQIMPGRRGAVLDHMLYRLVPGERTPHAFAILPRVGVRGNGISGALLPGVFGRPGTPEEGLLLVHSLHNCVIYAVHPDGAVEPWIVMDGETGPGPVMPYRLMYAPEFLVGEHDVLVIEGQWGTSFGEQIRDKFTSGHFRVTGRSVDPEPMQTLTGGVGPVAPPAFGPFAGQMFRTEDAGFLSAIHWTPAEHKGLAYTTSIVRRDLEGKTQVFASKLQAGQNLLGFAGNRMIITNLRHSYSTGDFHEPDGSVYEIRYRGA